MSKGSKQQYKQYTINTVEDACLVLKGLLVPVIIDLEKFEKYTVEAERLLVSYTQDQNIPADVYDSIHDKVLYQQRELLRFLADHQDSSFSYIDTREIMVKRGLLKRTLPEKSKEILNELLNLRNWSFHNVQSMLVADLELAKNSIPQEFQGVAEIRPMLNPVVIRKNKSYDRKMLEGLIAHNKERIVQFRTILEEMKADYQDMINALPNQDFVIVGMGMGKEVQYIKQTIECVNPEIAGSNIASLSMGIQKGKYDGTTATMEKLTRT